MSIPRLVVFVTLFAAWARSAEDGNIPVLPSVQVPEQFATIQAAVDGGGALFPKGFTVEIRAGTYTENVTISAKGRVVLVGKGKVVLEGGSSGCALEVIDTHVWLNQLRIVGGAPHGLLVTGAASAYVVDCRIEGAAEDAIHADVDVLGSVQVRLCRLRDVGGDGIDVRARIVSFYRNSITRTGGSGIRSTTQDAFLSWAALVVENRVRECLGDGIRLTAATRASPLEVEVTGNVLRDLGGDGVTIDGVVDGGSVALCTGNKLKRAGGDGVVIRSSQLQVVGNRVTKAVGAGLLLEGAGTNSVEGNSFKKCGAGVVVDSPSNVLSGNVVKTASDDGVVVGSSGNTVSETTVRGAGALGFDVTAGGNTLSANSVRGSDLFDCSDTSDCSNVYQGNEFKTVDSGGCPIP